MAELKYETSIDHHAGEKADIVFETTPYNESVIVELKTDIARDVVRLTMDELRAILAIGERFEKSIDIMKGKSE